MGLLGGLKSDFLKLCSKNEAAQAPTPPQNDKFSIRWHIKENSSFCGGAGACAASFIKQRLGNFGFRPS